jgi:nicotinamide-nucleotide amidase
MTTAFLATGDEIVHGDTLNSNSQTISQALSSEGIPLGFHLACSDKEKDLLAALEFLGQHHNIIITSGGLGPTSDDRTRFAVARYLHCDLVEHPNAVAHIEALLKQSNLNLKEENAQQAMFPKEAILLDNPNGTAMGCIIPSINHLPTIICLPGPPRECMPMMIEQVLPYLTNQAKSVKVIKRWMIYGQPESRIAHILDESLRDFDCVTGYRMDTPYVEFKVKMKPEDEKMIVDIVKPIIQPFLLSDDTEKASDKLRSQISRLPSPITILDEVTGGLLQNLVQTPETIDKVHFLPNHEAMIVFHLKGFDEYWHPKSPHSETTDCVIDYQSHEHQGSESHSLPLRRKAYAPLYVTEWLSFRLLHLINQLH